MLDNVGYTHWNWNMLDTQQCTYLCTLRHSRIRGIVHVRGPTPNQTHGNQVAFAAALVLCTVAGFAVPTPPRRHRALVETQLWPGVGPTCHPTCPPGKLVPGKWGLGVSHVFLGNNPVNLIWFNRGCCWEHGVSRCVI